MLSYTGNRHYLGTKKFTPPCPGRRGKIQASKSVPNALDLQLEEKDGQGCQK